MKTSRARRKVWNTYRKNWRETTVEVMSDNENDPRHGTTTGYGYGCRCGACKTAQSFKAKNKTITPLEPMSPKHGTNNGYTNYNCRCDKCWKASRAYTKQPHQVTAHAKAMAKYRYGLNEAEWKELQKIQTCQICETEPAIMTDHDHSTNTVRGRLCHQCNIGLGMFKDNIKTMEVAIEYLFDPPWQRTFEKTPIYDTWTGAYPAAADPHADEC